MGKISLPTCMLDVKTYDKKMPKVFVYGTLRAGEANHYILEDSICLSSQMFVKGYELRASKSYYPYAFFNPQRHIYGDLYEVSQNLLETKLDELEGTIYSYYIRHFDAQYQCYIYVKGQDDRMSYPLIESGDWIAYKQKIKPS